MKAEEEKEAEMKVAKDSPSKDSPVKESLNKERFSKFAMLIKHVILLCDPQTIEILMSERHYKMAFAALSELPEFKKRLDCREFFAKAHLRIVIPFKNERLLAKIHLYYRVNFLKETIFPNLDGAIQ